MDIPLCQNSHKPQLMLTGPEALPLYRSRPECFAGALAPDGTTCAKWAEALDGLPNGRKYTLTYAIEAVRAIIGDYLLRIKGCNLAQLNEVIRCESMCPNCLLTENCSLRDERVDQELREAGEIE